jgi:hypothetical protein
MKLRLAVRTGRYHFVLLLQLVDDLVVLLGSIAVNVAEAREPS